MRWELRVYLTAPELARIDAEEKSLTERLAGLEQQQAEHERWVVQHPEAARRIERLGFEIEALDGRLHPGPRAPERALGIDRNGPWPGSALVQERDFGIDL